MVNEVIFIGFRGEIAPISPQDPPLAWLKYCLLKPWRLRNRKVFKERILRLPRVCQVSWLSGGVSKVWKTGVIIHIHKKGSRKECTYHRGQARNQGGTFGAFSPLPKFSKHCIAIWHFCRNFQRIKVKFYILIISN